MVTEVTIIRIYFINLHLSHLENQVMSPEAARLHHALQSLSQQIPGMEVDLILHGRLIRQLAVRTTQCFNECLKQHGLTESLWYALLAVYARPQHALLPTELSEILDLTRTSATRLSDELVQQGWVERRAHRGDRRKITLHLTAAGEAKIHHVSPHTNALRRQLWSGLAAPERQQLHGLLQKLLHQLDVVDTATQESA